MGISKLMSSYWILLWLIGVLCDVAAGNMWRKSLEKEMLHHSIRYLREQLLVCMKTTDGMRGKRKADFDTSYWLAELEIQMDIDVLQNSEVYLMERLIHCRRRLVDNIKTNVDTLGLDQLLVPKVDKYPSHSPKLPKMPKMDVFAPRENVPRAVASEWKADEPEVHPTPEPTPIRQFPATSTAVSKSKVGFILDGRRVTCNSIRVTGMTFQCRDLFIDENERLPNKDFCPPTYNADRWRSVSDMAARTRDVIDVLNLCGVFGQNLKVPGYSKGARVVWGCDVIKTRLKWQNSRWAGHVEDNGFLHDLECVYSADIEWPLP